MLQILYVIFQSLLLHLPPLHSPRVLAATCALFVQVRLKSRTLRVSATTYAAPQQSKANSNEWLYAVYSALLARSVTCCAELLGLLSFSKEKRKVS